MGIVDDVRKGLEELGDWGRAAILARQRVWRRVAAERGGVYNEVQRGFLSFSPASIDVSTEDVAAHVDTYSVKNKNSSTTYTRFRASYLLPVGPIFTVKPDNVISSIGTALGFEDLTLGSHPTFDSRYVVRSVDAQAMRQAWTRNIADQMLRFFPGGTVRGDGHVVKLTTAGRLSDASRLHAGIDIVSAIGAYGAPWVASLRSLPGAFWVPPQGEWSSRTPPAVRLDVRGVPIWVYPVLFGVGLTFCAATSLRREAPPFESTLSADGSFEPAPPAGILPRSPARLLAGVGESSLGYDGKTLRLVLHGELGEGRVLAATNALAEICLGTAPKGAYR